MEHERTEKRRRFIIDVLYFALIASIVYLAVKYALKPLLPFIVAFVVATLLKPVVDFLERKLRFPRVLASLIPLILFYGVIVTGLILSGAELYSLISNFISRLPAIYTDTVEPTLWHWIQVLETGLEELSPQLSIDLNETADNLLSTLESTIYSASASAVTAIARIAADVPGFLLKLVITVMASVFMTQDHSLITRFIYKQLPAEKATLLQKITSELGGTLKKYILSYALILVITFSEIFVGLLILRHPNAALIAAVIAVFDILPIVGSGLVLLPWTIITFIQGNVQLGVGLAILYVVVIVVRQFIEPKIIGEQVGLHPVLTLMGMILGTAIFGGIGLFLVPISLAIIKKLNDQGAIHLYAPLAFNELPSHLQRKQAKSRLKGMRKADKKKKETAGKEKADEKGDAPSENE